MSKLKVTVAKFGGSSMKDASAIKRSATIVAKHGSNVVVVSATYGTTNQLVELTQLCAQGAWDKINPIVKEIIQRHETLLNELTPSNSSTEITQLKQRLELEYSNLFEELETLTKGMSYLKDAPKKATDRLLSLGERMSSPLMCMALANVDKREVENFDARKVIRTDDNFNTASAQISEIKSLCQKHMLDAKYGQRVFITQGFIGSSFDGETTTLGRGGSDYSAALLAEGLGADLLQIWTDVAGIATTDPRLCPKARPIKEITFKEAAELAIFGAKILHPTTLSPVQRVGTPVFVGSSYEPDAPGTWIRPECDDQPLVRAMALKKDQVLLTLTTPKMLNTHGFLARIFGVFDQHTVSVDAITTSEISVAMTIEKAMLLKRGFIEDLRGLGNVQVEENLAIVSLIGNGINHTPNLAGKIFGAMACEDSPLNVRMICLGASRHNFCLVLNEKDAPEAITRLHRNFIENQRPLL